MVKMKKGQMFVVAAIAIFALGMVASSSALATEAQWLIGDATIGSGSVDVDVTSAAKVSLEDMGSSAVFDVLCKIAGLDLIFPKGASEVSTLECSEPEAVGSGCTSPKVSPVHLPWTGQLLAPEEGVFVDDITAGTGGEPGWAIECTTLGVKVTDTCTTSKSSSLMINAAEVVEAEFMEAVAEEEQYNCTVGGAKKGLFVGKETLEALALGLLFPLAVGLA